MRAIRTFLAALVASALAGTGTPAVAAGLTSRGATTVGTCYASGASGMLVPCALQGNAWQRLYMPGDDASFNSVTSAGSVSGATLAGDGSAGVKATANGVTMSLGAIFSALPSLSNNVEGTGVSGYDFLGCTTGTSCGLMIRVAPTTLATATQPALRIQREASYSGGSTGGTVDSLWMLTYTSPTGAYYEWPFLSQMYNQTGGTSGNGAQNVAAGATAIKQFKSGYSYGTDQIGPTWGSNFVCSDKTATVNPTWSCIAQELDNYVVAGAGTDTRQTRVILQMRAGGGGTGDHVGLGILLGVDAGMTLDTGIKFGGGTGAGSYGRGIDFTNANGGYTNAAIALSAKNQDKIIWNDTSGNGTGVFNGSTAGFSIFAANDNTRYFDNYTGSNDTFRGSNGDNRFQVNTNVVTSFKPVKLKPYTVSSLPTCNTTYQDAVAVVTDAVSPTYRGALTGGGSVRTLAYCDGASWIAH